MYIAILGRQPALGIAELERLYSQVRWFSKESAVFSGEDFSIEHVGGSQKAGRIIANVPYADWKKASFKLVSLYSKKWSETGNKITLGISAYGFDTSPRDVQKTGLVLKSKLKSSGVSLRLIPNQEVFLNTASSHHNKLGLSNNKVELLVIKGSDGSAIIAESIGAQNITALAARDQGRPKRDAFVGMLPPKLAQIMINLAAGQQIPSHQPPERVESPLASKQFAQRLENEPNSSLYSAELASLRQSSNSKEESASFSGESKSASSASEDPTSTLARAVETTVERSSITMNATLDPESEPTSGPDSDAAGSSGLNGDGRRATLKTDDGSDRTKLRLLDPFCGTGVILQEAALLGFDVYGSDLAEKMIRYSRDNLNWLADTHHISFDWYLHEGDATDTKWRQPIDVVVAETYLGQPFSAPPSPEKLVEVRGNCNHIISQFLSNIAPQLKAGTPLCLAVPAWRDEQGNITHLPLIDKLSSLGYDHVTLKNISDNQLIYYREDQVVARELLVLTRN